MSSSLDLLLLAILAIWLTSEVFRWRLTRRQQRRLRDLCARQSGLHAPGAEAKPRAAASPVRFCLRPGAEDRILRKLRP